VESAVFEPIVEPVVIQRVVQSVVFPPAHGISMRVAMDYTSVELTMPQVTVK
jgi:hypothetical protein